MATRCGYLWFQTISKAWAQREGEARRVSSSRMSISRRKPISSGKTSKGGCGARQHNSSGSMYLLSLSGKIGVAIVNVVEQKLAEAPSSLPDQGRSLCFRPSTLDLTLSNNSSPPSSFVSNDGAVKRFHRRNPLACDQIRAAAHLRATAGNSRTNLCLDTLWTSSGASKYRPTAHLLMCICRLQKTSFRQWKPLEPCIGYNLTHSLPVFVTQSPFLPTDIPFAPRLYGQLLDQGSEAMAALFGFPLTASQVSYPP